jgi:hypothetical protein
VAQIQIQIPIPNKYLGFGYKGLVFWKNNGWLLTVPKCILINHSKIPQIPHNLSAQIVCTSPKIWDFDEKKATLGSLCICKWNSLKKLKDTGIAQNGINRNGKYYHFTLTYKKES